MPPYVLVIQSVLADNQILSHLQVAVKVITVRQPENASNLTKKHDELLQEIRVWGRLQNEHILPVLGYVHGHGHLPSLVFPWMQNGSLTTFLREHKSLERGERFRLVCSSQYDGIHVQTNFHTFSCKISHLHCSIVCLLVYKSMDSQVDFFISACYRGGPWKSNWCEFLLTSTRQTSTDYLPCPGALGQHFD
jgi:hypothetical protein